MSVAAARTRVICVGHAALDRVFAVESWPKASALTISRIARQRRTARPELALELEHPLRGARGIVLHLDLPSSQFFRAVEPWMPYAYPVGARGQVLQFDLSLRSGLAEVGCIGDVDITDHPVMDVAPELDHAHFVEQHRRCRRAAVQRQLKFLGGGKGIDVGADVFLVGEPPIRPYAY